MTRTLVGALALTLTVVGCKKGPQHTPRAMTYAQFRALPDGQLATTPLCGDITVAKAVADILADYQKTEGLPPETLLPTKADRGAVGYATMDMLACVAYPDEKKCRAGPDDDGGYLHKYCRQGCVEKDGSAQVCDRWCASMEKLLILGPCSNDAAYVARLK